MARKARRRYTPAMRRSRIRSSIGTQLFLALCVVSVLPLSSVAAVLSFGYSRELRRAAEDYVRVALKKAADDLSSYAGNLDRLLYQFQLSGEVQAAVKNNSAKSFKRRLDDRDTVRRALTGLKTVDADIDGVYLWAADGTWFVANDADNSVYRGAEYRLEREPWFDEVASGRLRRLVLPIAPNLRGGGWRDGAYAFGYARTIIDLDTGTPLGIVVMDVKRRAVDRIVKGLVPEAKGRFTLSDSKGREFYSSGGEDSAGEKQAIRMEVAVGELGWKAALEVPAPRLSATVRDLAFRAALVVLVTAATFMGLSSLVSRRVSSRFASLTAAMTSIGEGKFAVEIPIRGEDEIAYVARQLESTGRTLEGLWADLVLAHRREKELEFKALQAQINPHFIYNTLETINMRAVMSGDYQSSDILSAFGRMLRFAFDFSSPLVSLREELDYLRDYLDIETVRSSATFAYSIEVENDILDFAVPKLTLQPLAENSVQHGLAGLRRPGILHIAGRRTEEGLELAVADNGAGMEEAAAAALRKALSDREALKSGTSIGAVNVHDRIVALWGDEWGLDVRARPDRGCEWIIRIPAVPYKGEQGKAG